MADKPADVIQEQDGFFYKDGKRYCEDCWQPIPRYVDFPLGLVSPESDGDHGGNFAKYRMVEMGATEYSRPVREALRKAVCLDCYYLAFKRFYPGAVCAEFSRTVQETIRREEPLPEPLRYIPDPMEAMEPTPLEPLFDA